MSELPLSQSERWQLCAGKSATELRDLLFGGKVTINDVRREMCFKPIEGGETFCKPSRSIAPSAEENAA